MSGEVTGLAVFQEEGAEGLTVGISGRDVSDDSVSEEGGVRSLAGAVGVLIWDDDVARGVIFF